jgi:hypothetical protein
LSKAEENEEGSETAIAIGPGRGVAEVRVPVHDKHQVGLFSSNDHYNSVEVQSWGCA